MNLELLRKVDRVHPYPAKFTVDLALKYIEQYTREGDTVYDPFVGSGTTLLASDILGRGGYGTDINPIAILISKFKLTRFSEAEFSELRVFIDELEERCADEVQRVEPYSYPSVEHWFCENAIRFLSYVKTRIESLKNENEKVFCQLVMSAIINVISNQESDTRYAAVKKAYLNLEHIAATFIKKYHAILALASDFNKELRGRRKNIPCLMDARQCGTLLKPGSVDLILTSPPYVNTYDYYLYHKHRMNWLQYDVKSSMNSEIGSRREFSSLKHDVSKFNRDLKEIFSACSTVLKSNAVAVVVLGDGRVAGKIYDARENMERIGFDLGWKLIDHSYSLLDETSRSFQQAYRTQGKKEHILVFRKGS